MTPDLVYVCRTGPNEELRYSLRSAEQYMPDSQVWIVGGRPVWARGVGFLQLRAVTGEKGPLSNVVSSIHTAATYDDISDPFILMNDDFYFLKHQAVPLIHRGTLFNVVQEMRGRFPDGSRFIERMETSYDLLVSLGVDDPLCFQVHVPMLIYKGEMIAALRRMGEAGKLTRAAYRNVYGNLRDEPRVYMPDPKITDARVPGADWAYVSTSDFSFNKLPVGDWIRDRFTERSAYEHGPRVSRRTR